MTASRVEELTYFKLNTPVLSEPRTAATFPVGDQAHLWVEPELKYSPSPPSGALTHSDITATVSH